MCAIALAAALSFSNAEAAYTPPKVPEDIYQWVQSSERMNYYFNKQEICYAVDAKGHVDLDTLIVPVIKTYDHVQIEDVLMKRSWRMESTDGFGKLAGEADYLSIQIPQGVVKMSETMQDTVETSNNVGRILMEENQLLVTTHTRSFIDADMKALADEIKEVFAACGGASTTIMEAPAWQENQQSDFLKLTSDVFNDLLGWRPRLVAMHFVLEAGFFVQKFPGMEIACIGPRIVEPHSTSERVELKTVDDIWHVLQELLIRLAV